MPLQVTGRHMTIREDLKEYINKKADRLRRLCTKIDEMSMTLTREKLHFEAECSFRAGRIAVQATVSAERPAEAVDLLIDKVEAQIRKQKAKMVDRKAASREKARNNEIAMIEELTAPPAEEEPSAVEA